MININHHSITKLAKDAYQKKQDEPITSDTLTVLPQLSNADRQLYYCAYAKQQQILRNSIARCNLAWLQQELNQVNFKARHVTQTSQNEQKIVKFENNLQIITDKVGQTLQNLKKQRKRIKQMLIGSLLLREKKARDKNIKKINLLKYKEMVENILKLKNTNFTTESQITIQKQNANLSKINCIQGILNRKVIQLVQNALASKLKKVTITDNKNLQLIADYFIKDPNVQADMQTGEDLLYKKFKMYIKLKNYVVVSPQNKKIDEKCQQLIDKFYFQNLKIFTAKQHIKVRSLVQSYEIARNFLKQQSARHIIMVLKKLMDFLTQINNETVKINNLLIVPCLKTNKKLNSKQKPIIPSQAIKNFIQNQQFTLENITVQKISKMIQQINNVTSLLNLRKNQFKIQFQESNLKKMIIIQCIKCLVSPLIKLLLGLNSIIFKQSRQRKYHNCRLIFRHVLTWNQIYHKNRVVQKQILKQKINNTIQLLQQYNKAQMNDKSLKLNESSHIQNQNSLSIAQFFILYNNSLGQTYIYLANLLQQVDYKQAGFVLQNKFNPLSTSSLFSAWTELISTQVVNHSLKQFQPANILKNIKFYQNQTLIQIESQHKLQNYFSQLQQKISNKKKCDFDEDTKQQIYIKMLQFNLRVRNYQGLVQISKLIEADKQVKEINSHFYKQIYQNYIFD